MKRRNRLKQLIRNPLVCVLVLELVVAGWLVFNRTRRPAPLRVDATRLVDPITAADFRRLADLAAYGGADEWRELATAYAVYGFFPEAQSCCRHAATLAPDSFEVHYLCGIILNRLGRLTKSTKAFHDAIRSGDSDQQRVCWYLIGRNRLRQEKEPGAEAAFREARGLLEADYQLAFLQFRQRRFDEALQTIDRIDESADARLHTVLQLRARIAAAQGDDAAAGKLRATADGENLEAIATDVAADFLADQTPGFGIDRSIVATNEFLGRRDLRGAIHHLEVILQASFRPRVVEELAKLYLANNQPRYAAEILERLVLERGETPEVLELLKQARAAQKPR